MLRAAPQSVKVGGSRMRLAASLLVLGACYWSRYPEVMETHLVLLEQYARKLATLSEDGRSVPLEDWAEFVYPLERARDFARIAARRYPDRVSLARFRGALDRYAALIDDPGVLRAAGGRDRIQAEVEALSRAIASTRSALEEEQAG